ncbi:MAG: hypothetical protein AAFU64_01995 [Bacteroidota bacterium]
MAQFIAFNSEVEVNRQTVLSVVNSLDFGKEDRLLLLKNNGIDPEEKEWFSQQDWLNTFKDISDKYGKKNLFMIGKAIIENAEFPPMKNLEEALHSLDIAYHMNHRLAKKVMFDTETGEKQEGIGYYSLNKFDKHKKIAEMVCFNPYPSEFDRGVITQLARKFTNFIKVKVELDEQKETRSEGASTCTYKITW